MTNLAKNRRKSVVHTPAHNDRVPHVRGQHSNARAVSRFEPQRTKTCPSNFLGETRGVQGLSVEFKLDSGSPDRFMARESVSSFWVYGSAVGRVSAHGVGRVPPQSVRRVSSLLSDASPPFRPLRVRRQLPELIKLSKFVSNHISTYLFWIFLSSNP